MWPRRKRWSLMGSQGAPLPPKFMQGALRQWFESQQGIGPNYVNVNDQSDTITAATNNAAINAAMARQASQTPTAPFGGGIGKSAYQGVGSKKKGNKLKYIVEALRELEGETPDALAGRDRVGGTRPGMPGYTPTNMGAYVGDPVAMQAAIAEARRKKEKESLMNLLGGGY